MPKKGKRKTGKTDGAFNWRTLPQPANLTQARELIDQLKRKLEDHESSRLRLLERLDEERKRADRLHLEVERLRKGRK